MVTDYEEQGRVWDWTRHPKQDLFIWDRARFAVWQGGRGSTKTTSGMCRIWTTICDMETGEIRPEWRGARILIAAPVFKQVKRGPVIKFDEVFDDTGLVLHKVNGNAPRRDLEGDIEVHFFNVGPTGEGAESWRGSEYAIFYPDEVAQMPEKTFNLGNATLRQRHPNGTPYAYQTIMTTTPLGQNWLWRRLLNPPTRAEYKDIAGNPMYPDDKIFIIESSTQESVDAGILEPDYIANMGYIPGTLKYQEEVEGKVIATAGMVFEQSWNMISPENPLPKHFVGVCGGIDYGTVDPTAIILAGLDARGAVWVFKEFYEARAKFNEWIALVGDWNKEFTVRKWAVDSDLLVKMMRPHVTCAPPYKASDAAGTAINYINQLISRGMFNIDPHCYGLISEMRAYRHKQIYSGDEVTFLQKVESNQNDHAIDALRYAIFPLSSIAAAQNYGKSVEFSIG